MKLRECIAFSSSFPILFDLCSLQSVHDEVKDKYYELELSWICDESNRVHQLVPKDVRDDAINRAKETLKQAEM